MRSQPLLYDTHAWIWSAAGDEEQLGSGARAAIQAAAHAGLLRVAAISVWELAMLHAKGGLQLSLDLTQWVHQALGATGTRLVPLEPAISIESTRLPGAFHGDPADRLLVATARVLPACLLTRDRGILEYARHGHVEVLDASR
jgi:PIN domain nuclease of toxin-antitoxin system